MQFPSPSRVHPDRPPAQATIRAAARQFALTQPVLSVFAFALAIRVVVAVAAKLAVDGPLVPDEQQYITLARLAVRGQLDAEVWLGYGVSLYESTSAFMLPLTALTWVFGPHAVLGALWAALWGAVTAAATTALSLRAAGRAGAFAAGVVVAVLPSQVLWSSVVLRESMVWGLLALTAVALTHCWKAPSGRALVVPTLVIVGSLYALSELRPQTFVVAAWALPLAVLLARPRRALLVRLGALVLAVVVPWVGGTGPAGWDLVVRAVPSLATTRTQMSFNAESDFRAPEGVQVAVDGEPTPAGPDQGTGPVSGTAGSRPDPGYAGPRAHVPVDDLAIEEARDILLSYGFSSSEVDAALAYALESAGRDDLWTTLDIAKQRLESMDERAEKLRLVQNYTGDVYIIEESPGSHVKALLPGLIAVIARPFPWEAGTSPGMQLARLENVAWYFLFGLALVGTWSARRRREAIAYPFVTGILILGVAAVTQGNLGTAFRHRGQVLWAVALLAALGWRHLRQRRTGRATQ